MSRDERLAKESSWTCFLCNHVEAACPTINPADLENPPEEVATKMKTFTKDSLRILQWNANGLRTKSDELARRLKSLDIDVAIVQETMLTKAVSTPFIEGYKAIREDRRANIRGGGSIFYVKGTISYDVVGFTYKKGQEIHTIRLRIGKNKWVTITNFYCPPENSKGQEIQFDLDLIPAVASSIICGDFNAHHPIWDQIQPEDSRGTDMVDWSNLKNLSLLNDGSVSRHNPGTGNGSTPDITLCGSFWSDKSSWAVDGNEIGGSDHLPIIISIHTSTKHQPIMGQAARWRSNGVDWSKFRDEVENTIAASTQASSLSVRVRNFNRALTNSALKHVRKAKPGKRSSCWMTPKVRRLTKIRTTLRKSISTKRKEWIKACAEVTTAKQEARREQWIEVVNSAVGDIDERNMWKFIKSLNGSPDLNSPNEVMTINGKKIVCTKKKAEMFAQHYASVSRLKLSRQERRSNNLRLRRLLTTKSDEQSVPAFTLAELKKAIGTMRRKGAPGPDDIPPSFLKELGPIALNELLAICNLSLLDASCPQEWRNAIIIPLLKACKSPADLASYRPVSLTSCVAKVIERMLADRIYYLAETQGWFSSIQAGFRRGHSCVDQIIRISQAIEDGFQMPEMNRSVLVLLDYSKAFDTVWRERLLLSMADKGVPLQIIRWIFSFLQNRQARVRLHNELSSSKHLRQGVPQGCVLSPLLFLFFIDNLAEHLMSEDPERAARLIFSLFADDVTILARDHSRDTAAADAQWAVNCVVKWSEDWKLNLNASKSEVSFFSTWTHEADWEPSLEINGEPVPFQETPKLLGVYLDRQLSFAKQVEEVSKSASAKIKIICAVGNSKFGWDKEHLKKLYYAYVRSKLDYAGPGWQPWLSESNIAILERVQNKALRAITGQLRSSPVEALRLEAQVPSYETHMNQATLKSMEQAKRLPEDHPRRKALASAIAPRNDRNSWFRTASSLTDKFIPAEADTIDSRLPIVLYPHCPWSSLDNLSVNPELLGVSGKHDDHAAIRAAAERAISEWNSDLTIFTDGSAAEGYRNGGSAAVVHIHDDPPRSETICVKGAVYTSSFEEECQALESAAQWITDNCDASSRPLIITDSQSLCKALVGHERSVDDLRARLSSCPATIRIQWVPSHCGIEGNEEADEAANRACLLPGDGRPVSLRGICPLIKMNIFDPPCRAEEEHIGQIYAAYSKKKEQEITSRWDQTYLARLRAGHHWDLRSYLHRTNPDISALCPRCMRKDDTVAHLMECVGTMEARHDIFGTVEVPLSALTSAPLKSLALARRSLRGVGTEGGCDNISSSQPASQ